MTTSTTTEVTLAAGDCVIHGLDYILIHSIKGRWVKLADGRNISRADATAARQAFIDAETAKAEQIKASAARMVNEVINSTKTEDTTEAEAPAKLGYTGPMLALRERAKRGIYKKAANGQPSCGDEVAQILGALVPAQIIRACILALNLEGNPYLHLNIGQQSMNLRNKLRGALDRGEFGMGVLREAVEEVIESTKASE